MWDPGQTGEPRGHREPQCSGGLYRGGRDGTGVYLSTGVTALDRTPPASPLSQASWAPEVLRGVLVGRSSCGTTRSLGSNLSKAGCSRTTVLSLRFSLVKWVL